MEKKSTIHGTSVSYEDSTHKNNSRENIYTRHKRSMLMINKDTAVYHCNTSIFMINKDGVPRQHVYYYGLSMLMINKDGFSTTHVLLWLSPSCFQWAYRSRAKELKRCLSPPMRVANKLTPEPKSKMAENTLEHTGREQKSWKDAWARRWG